MAKYEVIFECTVTIEAKNASEAIKKAWLNESINNHSKFEYLDIKKVIEG